MRNVASIIAWISAGTGAVLLVLNHAVLAHHPIGIALQVLAVALMIWARLTLGLRSFHAAASPTAGELVTRGPFRFVRNPIYVSIGLFFGDGLAAHFTWPNAALFGLLACGLLARCLLEEAALRERYSDYDQYATQTRRLIPFF